MNAIKENLKEFRFIVLLRKVIVYKAKVMINMDIMIPKRVDGTLVKNINPKGTPAIPAMEGESIAL